MRATLFFLSHPLINLLLPGYRRPNISEALVIHEAMNLIALSESGYLAFLVFEKSPLQVIRYSRVQIM
jgi:hypothetical protein